MLTECPMCGKKVFSPLSRAKTCPQCGHEFSEHAASVEAESLGGPTFPQRTSPSLEDNLKRQKQEALEMKAIGEHVTVASWFDILRKRPMDTPFYTALKKRACLLVFLSSASVRQVKVLDGIFREGGALALQAEAFLQGPHPLLRMNLLIPDNPADPLILESPLNAQEGNVQDFCTAVWADEHIDVLVTHEQCAADERLYGVTCSAVGLANALKKQVKSVLGGLPVAASKEGFQNTVRMMNRVFPSGNAGVSPQKCVRLPVIGPAVHRHVEY